MTPKPHDPKLRRLTRVVAGSLAVTLASVGLVACGDSDDSANETTTTAEVTTTSLAKLFNESP